MIIINVLGDEYQISYSDWNLRKLMIYDFFFGGIGFFLRTQCHERKMNVNEN